MSPAEQELIEVKHRVRSILAVFEAILENYEGDDELDDYKQGKRTAYTLTVEHLTKINNDLSRPNPSTKADT